MSVELTRRRERWLLAVLGGVQCSTILDFMPLMPLGPQLNEEMWKFLRRFALPPART